MNKLAAFLDKQANDLKHELATRQAASMARQIDSNEPDFRHLEINAETNITADGIQLIMQALPNNRYITHISVKNRSFEGTVASDRISEFCELTICLTHLRLADCKGLDSMAASTLFKALEHNVSVQQLALQGNQLSCSTALASLLHNNFTLQAIDLSRNSFGLEFGPVAEAFSAVPSGNLKTLFLLENRVKEEDAQRLLAVLGKHPKSAVALTLLQFELVATNAAESPLQRDCNDLLYSRFHGQARPRAVVAAPSAVEDAVSKAAQALNVVSNRARGPSFQKTPSVPQQSQQGPTDSNTNGSSSNSIAMPHSNVTNTSGAPAAPAAKAAGRVRCEDRGCQTMPIALRPEDAAAAAASRQAAALAAAAAATDHRRLSEQAAEESEAAAGASAARDKLRTEAELHEQALHRLRDEVATERLARATLAETLQFELESERSVAAQLAEENKTLALQLRAQQQVLQTLSTSSRAVIDELRQTCHDAYTALQAALRAIEGHRAGHVQQQRQAHRMMLAMRATRAELDALLARNGAEAASACRAVTARLQGEALPARGGGGGGGRHDAGVVTDLTMVELEAYCVHRLAKHEQRRKARQIAAMNERRQRPPPVDQYAVTLAGEIAALARAQQAQEAKQQLQAGSLGVPSNAAATSGRGAGLSPARATGAASSSSGSAAAANTSAATTRRDSDPSAFVFVDDDTDLEDPSFQQMTKDRWEDARLVTDCSGCEKPFGLLKRKHHCRRCGVVYCDKCCPLSNLHHLRICVVCLHPDAKPPESTRSSKHSSRR